MEAIEYKALLEEYGGIAFEKQISLADVIEDRSWAVAISEAKLSFADDLSFPMQVLGTYSFSSKTWLWAWANSASNIPDNVLVHSNKLKEYGINNNVSFLQNDESDATEIDVHAIGIIASGMLGSSAYYAGNYGDGIILMTLDSKEVESVEFNEEARITTVFSQLISTFELNHKATLTNYLQKKQYIISVENNTIVGTKNDKSLTASFDELGRMTKLSGEIKQ